LSKSGALTASEAKRAELSLVLEFGQAVAEGSVRYLSAEGRVHYLYAKGRVRYLFAEGGDATRPRPLILKLFLKATKTHKCTVHVT
jgi:hypothetical protein